MPMVRLDHVHAQLQGCEINFSSTKMQTIRRIFARIQTVTEAEPVRIFTLRRGEKLIKRRRVENGFFLYLIQWSKVIVFICGIKRCSCCSPVKQTACIYFSVLQTREITLFHPRHQFAHLCGKIRSLSPGLMQQNKVCQYF